MSFPLHRGFEARTEAVNELEFKTIARTLKALALEQGLSEDHAIDQLVRQGPYKALAGLRKPAA